MSYDTVHALRRPIVEEEQIRVVFLPSYLIFKTNLLNNNFTMPPDVESSLQHPPDMALYCHRPVFLDQFFNSMEPQCDI